VHKAGLFKRFGVSNFSAADVENIVRICKAEGYVAPTVYQGNYSPVARLQEEKLFPALRQLGIAFFAYSPLAGGFLTKTAQQIKDGAGRFDEKTVGGMYRDMYMKPAFLDALARWEAIANDEGCSRAELAYRWVAHNSGLRREYGDAIIVGASSCEQLEQTLSGIDKGGLSEKAIIAINAIWEDIKHEAPLDNFNR
jgi:aflatoxin B1 aldehyde reductase